MLVYLWFINIILWSFCTILFTCPLRRRQIYFTPTIPVKKIQVNFSWKFRWITAEFQLKSNWISADFPKIAYFWGRKFSSISGELPPKFSSISTQFQLNFSSISGKFQLYFKWICFPKFSWNSAENQLNFFDRDMIAEYSYILPWRGIDIEQWIYNYHYCLEEAVNSNKLEVLLMRAMWLYTKKIVHKQLNTKIWKQLFFTLYTCVCTPI